MNSTELSKKEYNPKEKYSLKLIDIEEINEEKQDDEITTFFWHRCPVLLNSLCMRLERLGITENVLDVGCGGVPFPKATHLMDFNNKKIPDKTVFQVDLDYDLFPYQDSHFNFTYCRHTLEDIQNPLHAFKEIVRVSKRGFIETPSPLIELVRGVDGSSFTNKYRGYIHHRYIVWSDHITNTLHFLPKYPIIEYIVNDEALKKYVYVANRYSVYWNNYYVWDETNKPNIIVYRNDVNMKIKSDFSQILDQAVLSSILYTNKFISELS